MVVDVRMYHRHYYEDNGLALRHAQDDVQVPIQIEVDRPRSGIGAMHDLGRQFRLALLHP